MMKRAEPRGRAARLRQGRLGSLASPSIAIVGALVLGAPVAARAELHGTPGPGGEAMEIDAGEREVLPIVLLSPSRQAGLVSGSEIVDTVASTIKERTFYDPVVVDESSLLSCEGRLPCMLRRLETEAKRAVRGTVAPAARAVTIDRVAGDEQDLIGLTVYDLSVATGSSAAEGREGSDLELARRATLVRSPRLRVSSADELRLRLQELWEDSEPSRALGIVLRDVGALRVEGVPEGGALLVDGRMIVQTAPGGSIVIRNLRPGSRRVVLRDERYYPIEAETSVAPRAEVVVDVRAVPIPHPLRTPMLWTSAAMIGAGSVLLAIGLIDAATTGRTACIWPPTGAGEPQACPPRFARPGDEDGVVRAGGVPLPPLGYSLMIGGVAGYLTTRLLGEYDNPWLALLVSGVVASASMTVSMVLEP
ncbi:MAG: hypothetical protein IT384_13105 [Deltaproteobacteria bacterium]|nr:hypothetical protein [Deltaproteobacteria bacterium]